MIDDRDCLKLVHRAKACRTGGPTELTELDEVSLNGAIQGIRSLYESHQRDLGNPYIVMSDLYYTTKMEAVRAQMFHDKRCICSYLKSRLDALTHVWWNSPGGVTSTTVILDKACPGEKAFVRDHASLMVAYMSSLGGLDLRMAAHGPPKVQRYVLLQGVRDYVFVSTMSGRTVQVYPGKCLSLVHEDATALVSAGVAIMMK